MSDNKVLNEELTEEVVHSEEETMPDSDIDNETETPTELKPTDTVVSNAYSEN